MRRGHRIHVVALAARSQAAMEAPAVRDSALAERRDRIDGTWSCRKPDRDGLRSAAALPSARRRNRREIRRRTLTRTVVLVVRATALGCSPAASPSRIGGASRCRRSPRRRPPAPTISLTALRYDASGDERGRTHPRKHDREAAILALTAQVSAVTRGAGSGTIMSRARPPRSPGCIAERAPARGSGDDCAD